MSNILTHLPHFEDLVLLGAFDPSTNTHNRAFNLVKDIMNGRADVRYKIDGRPAIILGSDESINDGKFFVKTKWANCPPISSDDDIPTSFSDEHKHRMSTLINELKDSTLKGVYHADLLYLPNTITRTDQTCTFEPNTIQYIMPRKPELDHEVGLCVHSKYRVSQGALMYDIASVVDQAYIRDNLPAFSLDNTWYGRFSPEPCDYTSGDYTSGIRRELKQRVETARYHMNPEVTGADVCQLLVVYVNTQYKHDGVVLSAAGFKEFIEARVDKATAERKTITGKQRVQAKYRTALLAASAYANQIDDVLIAYALAKLLKGALLEAVGPMPDVTQRIDGMDAVYGEGLVAISKEHNVIAKFVPRDTFSRANFRKNDNV